MTDPGMRFVLPKLASHELAELGMRIRRCTEGTELAVEGVAQQIVDLLWDSLGGGITPQLALVRMYLVRRCSQVAPELAPLVAGLPDGARCMTLVATRGLEPEWNEVRHSERHRILPLDDREALARAPMVAKLVTDLALARRDADEPEPDSIFFVEDAIGSPLVPEQRTFVLRFGIRSVIGCGGALPDGEGFAIILFTRVLVTADVASSFATIGLQAALALGHASDLGASPESVIATRARGYERLLRLQEYLFIKLASSLGRDLEDKQQRVVDLERAMATESVANIKRHERAQRAMLNVIEDLREARSGLEKRVTERTMELERSNAELRSMNSELEQFAYVASHDLQEPLRTIAGYLQLLRERHGEQLPADAHEFIDYAVRGTTRLQELIEALLSYSRISRAPADVGVVALDAVLDDTIISMARSFQESGARLERAPLPSIRGDFVLLRQLFQNLFSNAIKFAKPSGPHIEVGTRAESGRSIITVRDHGVGFDARYAAEVFKVFRRLQRKQPGTGIGLAICKKIVERHGGTIDVSAALGIGATFTISFPAVESP